MYRRPSRPSPSALRSAATLTLRLLSSTMVLGQTRATSSSLGLSGSSGGGSATNCKIWKRPGRRRRGWARTNGWDGPEADLALVSTISAAHSGSRSLGQATAPGAPKRGVQGRTDPGAGAPCQPRNAVAGSLRCLPTRPKRPGASKGVTTPRTRSSNPVSSTRESVKIRVRALPAAIVDPPPITTAGASTTQAAASSNPHSTVTCHPAPAVPVPF